MPPKLNPQVPGEAQQTAVDQVEQTDTNPVETNPRDPSEVETVAVPKAQLDALLARVAALEAKPAVAPRVSNGANLPDQDSVDPDKIKTPVLSKQGWVVPTSFGANPAQKAL